jgi:uncharacterized membrane protein
MNLDSLRMVIRNLGILLFLPMNVSVIYLYADDLWFHINLASDWYIIIVYLLAVVGLILLIDCGVLWMMKNKCKALIRNLGILFLLPMTLTGVSAYLLSYPEWTGWTDIFFWFAMVGLIFLGIDAMVWTTRESTSTRRMKTKPIIPARS